MVIKALYGYIQWIVEDKEVDTGRKGIQGKKEKYLNKI